jgi:hypothetical protein
MATYRCRTPLLVFRQVDIRCSNDRILMAQGKGMFARENPFHTSRCMLATTRSKYSLHRNGKQSRQDARTMSRLTPSEPTPLQTENHCANQDQGESSDTYSSQGTGGRAKNATSTHKENTNKAVSGAHRQRTREQENIHPSIQVATVT